MIRTSINTVSDEEFDKIVFPFDEAITKYIDNLINDYIAYYLAMGYKMSAIWNSSLETHCNSSIGNLTDINNFDYDTIKEILEKKYGLKIINDEQLEIEESKNPRLKDVVFL